MTRLRIILYTAAAFLALLGLAISTYLTVPYLTGQIAVCGGSAGCASVLGSRYARLLGIPVAALGALAYFSAFSLATYAAFGYARAARLLVWTSWTMAAASVWFIFVQAVLLHAFCRYCLFSAALTFFLAGLVPGTAADLPVGKATPTASEQAD